VVILNLQSCWTCRLTVTSVNGGFHIEGYEKITCDFRFIDNIFDRKTADLVDCYRLWGRCLIIIDNNVQKLYGQTIETYFSE